jgi:hypothetical protein
VTLLFNKHEVGFEAATAVSFGQLSILTNRVWRFGFLSCRGDCGTLKLGSYFHTHDFQEHANAPAVVQMRDTTEGFAEWPRRYAHFLADLETISRRTAPQLASETINASTTPGGTGLGCSAPIINEAMPNVPLTLRQRCLERSMIMKIYPGKRGCKVSSDLRACRTMRRNLGRKLRKPNR